MNTLPVTLSRQQRLSALAVSLGLVAAVFAGNLGLAQSYAGQAGGSERMAGQVTTPDRLAGHAEHAGA